MAAKPNRRYRFLGCLLPLLLAGLCSCMAPKPVAASNPLGVRISQTNDCLRVELNGRLFTQYFYTNVSKPFCYPLMGPGGIVMTRHFPMASPPGEEHDHRHHRSFWYGHEPVNGVDIWTERTNSGRIVHRGFVDISSGVNTGLIKTLNDWVDAAGKVLGTSEQTLRFYAPNDGAILIDFEITFRATQGEVIFGDSKEGTFALRVAESMRAIQPVRRGEPPQPGAGRIVLSTGESDDGNSAVAARLAKRETNTWGKRAAWCDYSGPVAGKTMGIAIFDHPSNPRHPTWWQVRDYGLLAANPFGQAAFEGLKDRRAGDLKIPAGGAVRFCYRVVLHEGDERQAQIAALYETYAKTRFAETK